MMRRIWIHKAKSFAEAKKFDRQYYANMSAEERLSIVQDLRESHLKFFPQKPIKKRKRENRERLCRITTIIR